MMEVLKGSVKDAAGEAIIGASVVVEGTTNGLITDVDGHFSIQASVGQNLVISYIGYETQVMKIARANQQINIVLKESSELIDEVVVVAYGTQKKANLTGAVSSVKVNDIKDIPVSNTSSLLQGRMSGVTVSSFSAQPGAEGDVEIRIRGINTFGDSNPMVLIDGVEGDPSMLNPNDIESISVLKDASSAAIYGSKASNGVILITTKRGKTGAPRISYNGYVGASKATSMIDRVSSADYARLWNRFEPGRYSDEDIRMFEDGSDPYGHPNTDWNDEAYRTGLLHKHNVSITGGAENVKYMASAGYLGQTGILPNSENCFWKLCHTYH